MNNVEEVQTISLSESQHDDAKLRIDQIINDAVINSNELAVLNKSLT